MKKQQEKLRKGVTLDGLARMMAGGFDTLSQKIDTKVDGKEMNARFAELNASINRMELQLISTHDRRLDKLEGNVQMIKTILEQKLEVTFRK
ncbi:MAG: hypothetical protein Q7R54_01435 [bacterium]|nr:hypothetical protein [bacterium]